MLETTLPNGLGVIVHENHGARVAAAQVWVRVGSADELPDEAGLAHVHEHMLFKGTERRPVGAIAAEIEAAGGEINAWTSYDQTVYHVTMASRDFDVGLDILADAVQHSSFDAHELDKELEVVLEEVRRGKDMPARVLSENLFSTSYRVHPYSRPVIGYVDTVKSFTRDKILDFYRRWYRPKNMCLVVVGDVNAEAVVEQAKKLFDATADSSVDPERPRRPEPVQEGLRWVRVSKDVQETHLGIGWHGVELRHDDTPAMDVLSILLGNGESSRLYRRVKREAQLVNDCYAYAYTPRDPGLLMVGANIHGDKIEDAYRGLLRETLRMKHESPAVAEVDKAKTILLSDAVYNKETVQGVARKLGYFELVAGSPSYEQEYYDGIRQVTPQDVQMTAQKYLGSSRMTVSVLLPDKLAGAMGEDITKTLAEKVERDLEGEHAPCTFELGPERVAKHRLANGATLLVREDRAVPLVSVRAASKGGLLAEDERISGVTHLTAELLVRGTRSYSADQIAEETDATASGISGVSGRNSLGLRGDFLAEHWNRGFDLFAECLLEPVFDPDEIERERKTQIEDIASRQDNLSAVAFDSFAASMWQTHPYRLPVMGTKASIEALDRADILAAFRAQLRPDRLTIAVVGAVDIARTIESFERRIGTARPHADAGTVTTPPVEVPPEEPRTVRASRNKEQAHLVLGFPGIDLTDSRRWPLEVLTSILSGQGGRLFLELRDKASLAYAVAAFSQEGLAPGYVAVYMGTAQDKLATAEAGIRRELSKVIDAGVEAAEVARAQRYLIGTHEIALQRMSARSGTMALNEAYDIGYDDYAHYASRIEKVTAEQIHTVAKDLLRFDRAVMSVIEAAGS